MVTIVEKTNFIWDIANKLRGSYMPDKYGDVVIPMTILRRFECTLAPTRKNILEKLTENNLTTKRPGNGISPMKWNSVIGTYAVRDFEEDEIIEI